MLSIEQFLLGGFLCAKILPCPISPPPSPHNTKNTMQNLQIINITNSQESSYISETKYQSQKHTSSPYLWLCLTPSYKRLPQNIPQKKQIQIFLHYLPSFQNLLHYLQIFLKVQYTLFHFQNISFQQNASINSSTSFMPPLSLTLKVFQLLR